MNWKQSGTLFSRLSADRDGLTFIINEITLTDWDLFVYDGQDLLHTKRHGSERLAKEAAENYTT